MDYQITWTPNAEKELDDLIEYLADYWSPQIAIRFVNDFYEKLDLIAKMPYIGVASPNDETLRKILITNKNQLFYKIENTEIILVSLADTRQNPDFLLF